MLWAADFRRVPLLPPSSPFVVCLLSACLAFPTHSLHACPALGISARMRARCGDEPIWIAHEAASTSGPGLQNIRIGLAASIFLRSRSMLRATSAGSEISVSSMFVVVATHLLRALPLPKLVSIAEPAAAPEMPKRQQVPNVPAARAWVEI